MMGIDLNCLALELYSEDIKHDIIILACFRKKNPFQVDLLTLCIR